jgi:hypothetical protein
MDLRKALQSLYNEKRNLDRVIGALEQLNHHQAQQQQQPPELVHPRRGRQAMGTAERIQVSQRMRNYWQRLREQKVTHIER